jgi:hypothetical protein
MHSQSILVLPYRRCHRRFGADVSGNWFRSLARTRRALFVVWLAMAAGAGCSSDGPTAPSGQRNLFGGTWVGRLADNAAGEASLTFVLTADPAATAGTWTVTRGGQSTSGRALAASSLVSGADVHRVSADCADGGGFWLATVAFSGARMTGTYDAFACTGFTAGSIDVVRQ